MIWIVGFGAFVFALLAHSFLSPDPKGSTAAIVCFVVAVALCFEFARRFRVTSIGARLGRVNDVAGFALFICGCLWLWEYAAWHLVKPTPIFPAPSTLLNSIGGGAA